jgi:thiosulfate/3-mercaptopyruvate sulfurtransferase
MSDRAFGPLVETGWLDEHLGDPDLRVLDCTVFLRPIEGGVRPESGRAEWERAHIPGSAFADLPGDLSDRETRLPIMMPPAGQFAEMMSRYGVGDEHRVVLYDAGMNLWAARLWWMLRAFGFERAAVLNGGWKKWTAEHRPVATGEQISRAPARFTPRLQTGRFVDWKQVLAAIDDPQTRLVNALSADEFAGRVCRVARPGHIPHSVNVPAGSLVDPATHAYLDVEALRAKFAQAGVLTGKRVITYCGGGIAACSDALALTVLGADDVAVYDGSLVEWSSRPELPLEVGDGSAGRGLGRPVARVLTALAGTLLLLPSARAHHSYAMFDGGKTLTVAGTVAKLEWSNPHVYVWVYVPNPRASSGYDLYGFENGSTGVLARLGWSKSSLVVGEKITVEYWPLKDGRTGGHFVKATHADGRVAPGAGGPGATRVVPKESQVPQ